MDEFHDGDRIAHAIARGQPRRSAGLAKPEGLRELGDPDDGLPAQHERSLDHVLELSDITGQG